MEDYFLNKLNKTIVPKGIHPLRLYDGEDDAQGFVYSSSNTLDSSL